MLSSIGKIAQPVTKMKRECVSKIAGAYYIKKGDLLTPLQDSFDPCIKHSKNGLIKIAKFVASRLKP